MTEKKMTKGERTAQRIMDAAERLFAQNGYEGTSLREIAAAVEIQEPGLYRHFENKDALYRKVLERSLQPLLDTLEQRIGAGPSLEQIAELPAIMLDLLARHPHIAALFQQAVMAKPERQTELNQWLNELLGKGSALVEMAPLAESAIDADEVALRIMNLFNLCTGYFSSEIVLTRLVGKGAQDPDLLEKQKRLLTDIARSWLGL